MNVERERPGNWRRFPWALSWIALAGLFSVLVYGFALKARADLGWDEAMNQRVYARHPLTALALYHEPNNHVLDSFFKSLFYWGLGLENYPWRRLPGVLIGAAFLFFLIRAVWQRWQRGEKSAALLLALLIGTSSVFNDHALEMRGYFPSMLLAFVFIGLQQRGVEAQVLRRRRVLLAGALVFLVPTNLVLSSALLLWAVFSEQGSTPRQKPRSFFALLWRMLALSLLLYSPILLSLLLGISHFHGVEAQPQSPGMAALSALETTLPAGIPLSYWAAFLGLATLAALRKREQHLARSGLFLMLVSWLSAFLLQISLHVPVRAIAAFGIPFVLGLDQVLRAILASWTPALRLQATTVLVMLFVVPAIPALWQHAMEENAPRPITDLMTAIKRTQLIEPRATLALHEANSRLRLELESYFGPSQVAGSEEELRARQLVMADSQEKSFVERMKESIRGGDPRGLELTNLTTFLLIEDEIFRGSHWFDRRTDWSEILPGFKEAETIQSPYFQVRVFRR